jgi:hypothetical protein
MAQVPILPADFVDLLTEFADAEVQYLDLIAMKIAADRDQDRMDVKRLERIRQTLRQPKP